MRAIIMAGGRGSRIAPLRSDVPKPMIALCGKPVLSCQIDNLAASGIKDITIVTGYMGQVIRDYFGSGEKFGARIRYFHEDRPLGTAGALFEMPRIDEDILLLNGDILFDIDFSRFIAWHRERGGLATLLAHPNSHPFDSSLLVTETIFPEEGSGALPKESGRVLEWLSKEDARPCYKNLVNAGIEILTPELLDRARKERALLASPPERVDLDREVLRPAVSTGRVFAYRTSEYIKDMGTPERLCQVERDIKRGLAKARNLRRKQKAVFLDRDGTINEKRGFLRDSGQLKLLPGAARAIRAINASPYLAIVVTNQPQIARGELSWRGLWEINRRLETLLGEEGAYIDGMYICPHHPDSGFPGERRAYKGDCACRKPKPGLLLRAAEDLNIDLSASFMVGDSDRDRRAGENAGCRKSVMISEDFSLLDFVRSAGFEDGV